MKQLIRLLVLLSFATPAVSDILASARISTTGYADEHGLGYAGNVQPNISLTANNRSFVLTSHNSSDFSADSKNGLHPISWQSANSLANSTLLPQTELIAQYTHSETDDVLSGSNLTSNLYSLNASTEIFKTRISTNTLTASLSHTQLVENDTSSQVDAMSFGYMGSRLSKTGNLINISVSSKDYLNGDAMIASQLGLIRLTKSGNIALAAGTTLAFSNGTDSLVANGAFSLTQATSENSALNIQISKAVADYASIAFDENTLLSISADHLVDTLIMKVGLDMSYLKERLQTSVAYQYSVISSVFESTFAGTTESTRESDAGSLNLSYLVTRKTTLSSQFNFSLSQGSIHALGDITSTSQLSRNLNAIIGLRSNDFSQGLDQIYASLSYQIGRGN